MSTDIADPTQEAGSFPAGESMEGGGKKADARGFLGAGLRDLSEDDMATAAARRFLIYEIERLDGEVVHLKGVENRYNELRVEAAELREKVRRNSRFEVLVFVASTGGAAGLGAAPSFMTVAQVSAAGWAIAIISLTLVLGSALSRVIR